MVSTPLAPDLRTRPAGAAWQHAVGWSGLFLAYLLVLSLTGSTPARAIGWAAANVAPAAGLGYLVHLTIRRRLIDRPAGVQLALHIPMAVVFVGGWYGLLIPAYAVCGLLFGDPLRLAPLTGPALPWQLFHGLTLYCVIAATTYALSARIIVAPAAEARPVLKRYLMRRGEDLRPVDVDDIISIAGADDYSEVQTIHGVHLARMTLSAFEAELDPLRFVRVHRSGIINFDRMVRAEPAGAGRLLAHMENGSIVPVSRGGARALRDRLV